MNIYEGIQRLEQLSQAFMDGGLEPEKNGNLIQEWILNSSLKMTKLDD